MARVTLGRRLVLVVAAAAAVIDVGVPAVLAPARAVSAERDRIPAPGRAAYPGAFVENHRVAQHRVRQVPGLHFPAQLGTG